MFFSTNLKFLRERKGISQTDLAHSLELSRTTLIGYEKGVQPPFPKLIRIAEYFKISLDALIRYDLTKLSAFQLSEIERGMDVDITGQKLRVLITTSDRDGNENIEMVATKAQAGYANGYGDPEFMERLPKFRLPFLPKGKTYRCFQIKGDSMLPIPENAWVTGSFVQDWNHIKNGTPCVIVTKDDGVVFKLIYPNLREGRSFQLVSSNRIYEPYTIPAEDVLEIWQFETWNSFEVS
ncbi:MAG: helix-turn-helix domain-containing protein [Bacteroidetes bacterium]|nr:MAG: helix-turn-helix domain-containing protein [Bacteroidota bacterium]